MTNELAERQRVVEVARSYIGTPYHSCAAIKGVGIDCGTLLREVFVEAGLVPTFEIGAYPIDFHLNRREERYLEFIRTYLTEFEGPPDIGDVIMFHFGHSYSHGAIVTEAGRTTIVHAVIKARRVIEEHLTRHSEVMAEFPGRRPPIYFTRWAKDK